MHMKLFHKLPLASSKKEIKNTPEKFEDDASKRDIDMMEVDVVSRRKVESNDLNKTTINPDITFLKETNEDLTSILENLPPGTTMNEKVDLKQANAVDCDFFLQKDLKNNDDFPPENDDHLETSDAPRILEETMKKLRENETGSFYPV